jgi:hypothetical protein
MSLRFGATAVDVCMMGVKRIKYLRENLKVLEKRPMMEKALDRIS